MIRRYHLIVHHGHRRISINRLGDSSNWGKSGILMDVHVAVLYSESFPQVLVNQVDLDLDARVNVFFHQLELSDYG